MILQIGRLRVVFVRKVDFWVSLPTRQCWRIGIVGQVDQPLNISLFDKLGIRLKHQLFWEKGRFSTPSCIWSKERKEKVSFCQIASHENGNSSLSANNSSHHLWLANSVSNLFYWFALKALHTFYVRNKAVTQICDSLLQCVHLQHGYIIT